MSSFLMVADAKRIPLATKSADLIVTSPPYFGMRDYGAADEIGAECSVDEYVRSLRLVLAEMARILKPAGSVFMVIGDKYARTGGVDRKPRGGSGEPSGRIHLRRPQRGVAGVPDKSLIGLPYRLALAAIDDGWLWRQEIVWHKPNPLPESVTDRCQRSHETILHLVRSGKYWAAPRRLSDVWVMPVRGYRDPGGGRHPATFPIELVRRIIDGWCPPGGIVVDPFVGSGTSVLAAVQSGRVGVGCDLNRDYLRIAARRVQGLW